MRKFSAAFSTAFSAALAVAILLAVSATRAHAAPRLGECAVGELCLWQHRGFHGERYTYELLDTGMESCVTLPESAGAVALANRTGRPVTVYQSAVCEETGEFHTYPSGAWAPESSYAVRGFKVWER
ncbi:peptidase inhibitor family I36 protein [Streptomyces gobiensis]|uniref:peptidase inhibitor family I36 protein n=1 Tax=Streptomyces gobiensis TaxID=2875706 RepID=UPI001E65236F|nr:peptidase inhibitor family I36 protein [Streptomyces gobiensis]UGY91185.1 peptidase inhibitor family I36 protein [Streptomyces gobiensis]